MKEYNLCSKCPIPYNLVSNQKDILFFTLGYELFRFDIYLNKIQYLCKPPRLQDAPFASDGSDIFQIYTTTDTVYKIDSMFFGKADITTNEFTNIKFPGNDRYIDNLSIKDIKFLSKDTVIAVGSAKLIYMSYNGGINWELKSLLSVMVNSNSLGLGRYAYIFLKDNQNARIIADEGKFISTKNGGSTWLPQKNYHPVFVKNSSFATIKYKSIPYFFDLNNGFIYGESLFQKIDTNILYTNDGGETVEMKKIENLQHFNNETEPLLTVYKGYPIILTQRSLPNNPHYSVFDIFNSNTEIVSRKYIQDTMIYCIFNINDKFYAVGRDYKQESPYTYKFYHSDDTSFKWISDFSFNVDSASWSSQLSSASNIDDIILLYFSYTKLNNNKVLQFAKIFSIDISSKTIKEVYKADYTNLRKAIKLNNKYFAIFQKDNSFQVLYSDVISKPLREWSIIKFSRLSPPFIYLTESHLYQLNGFLSDTLFYFVAHDSLFNRAYLFKAHSKKNLNVEANHQVEVISNVYIQSIHPNPANDFIKIKMLWNQVYDIDKADFKVLNILGEIVAKKEEFHLTKLNSYSGELLLNTKELTSSVYLISATLEGNTYTQAFIVLK